jgi:hypothetical protein
MLWCVCSILRMIADMTKAQLEKALDAAGLSQSEAARQLGLDPRSMRRYIAGEVEVPRFVEFMLETWNDTNLRGVNARLRGIVQFAQRELRKLADGTGDGSRTAKGALRKIDEMLAEWLP